MPDALGTGDPLLDGHAEGDVEFAGDALCLGHHAVRQLAGRRILANRGERRARERADGVEGEISPELEPDLRADVVEHRRLQAASGETLRDALDALARAPVGLAHGEAVALDVLDDAGPEELRRRINHAADDSLARDVLADRAGWIDAAHLRSLERSTVAVEVPEGNAILHRHDHGIGTEELGDVRGNRLDLMSLHGKDHDVLRSRCSVIRRRVDPWYRLLAPVAHEQPNAARAQRVELRAARDESDVLAGVRETRPDVAADRTDPDDRYLQVTPAPRRNSATAPILRQAAGEANRLPGRIAESQGSAHHLLRG